MASLFKSADELVAQYAGYHRDRRNIATHLVGIPLIVTALAPLLAWPVVSDFSVAWCLWALASLWYLTRGALILALATCLFNGLCLALGERLMQEAAVWGYATWQTGVALFAVGWVFQFVGHYWEGRKPAFVDDVVGLLVGPMFVTAEILSGVRQFSAMLSLRR